MLSNDQQSCFLYQSDLEFLLDHSNPLYILSNKIDWSGIENEFKDLYCEDNGRPAKPIRLMVGLQYLKFTFDLSDEEIVLRFVENPYWQYFCGEKYFQKKPPLDPSSLTRWRQRAKSKNLDELLTATIETGLEMGAIRKTDLEHVNVDTTVSEKNISFPTDAKLVYKMILKLGKLAKSRGIKLRQSFVRVGAYSYIMQSRLRRANQHKKANKQVLKLKKYLEKLIIDIKRKASPELLAKEDFQKLFEYSEILMQQDKNSKKKIYSIHEPDVECIGKGKAHKKFEFGTKVGIVSTAMDCFVLSALAFHGAPYDGHTLKANLKHSQSIIDGLGKIKYACVDQGYRKHDYDEDEITVNIVKRGWRKADRTLRKWLSRRSAIEPVIGHMKSDCRLGRNYLKGQEGDRVNAILCACGYNLRKLLAHIFCFLLKYCRKLLYIAILGFKVRPELLGMQLSM